MHKLTLYQWQPSIPLNISGGEYFVLSTCQRQIVVSFKSLPIMTPSYQTVWHGAKAYRYLLEIVCGLKSRLVGETEIVAQYKEAMNVFAKAPKRNCELQGILEKILKDSKEIRSQYLNGLGQYSYAGLSKKLLKDTQAKEVIIIGSGAMAEDLIKVLQKKYQIKLFARNQERLLQLKERYQIQILDDWCLTKIPGLYKNSHIINTVGTDNTLFCQNFFKIWHQSHLQDQRLFVCLAKPSPLCTTLTPENAVYQLEHLFSMAEEKNKEKLVQVALAHQALDQLVSKRYEIPSIRPILNNSSEEFCFA